MAGAAERDATDLLRLTRRLRLLLDVSLAVGSTLELDAVLGSLLDQLVPAIPGADSAIIFLFDSAAQVLVPQAATGLDPQATAHLRLRPGEGMSGMAFAEQRTIVSHTQEEVSRLLRTVRPENVRHIDQASGGRWWERSISVPLRTRRGAVIGVLSIGSRHPTLGDDELGVLEAVASQAAMAIHNAQLYAEAQLRTQELQRALTDVREQERTIRQQAERLRLLNEFARVAGSTLDLQRIFSVVAEQVAALMSAQRCAILRYEAEPDLFRYAAIWHDGRVIPPRATQAVRGRGTLAGQVRDTLQPYLENDTRTSPVPEVRARGAEGILSLLTVPIVVGDRFWGTINVGLAAAGAATEQHQDFLTAIAAHLAVAIQNAELFTSERSAHEQLRASQQQALQQERLRALGQMASGIVHDLNQYLALIVGHGELALRELDHEPLQQASLRDSLGLLTRAATDGASAVKRLLAFARPASAGPPERVPLAALLREVVTLTAPRWRDASVAGGSAIDLRVEVTDSPEVEGWPAELREALINLVFNAVDALPHGGTIRLAARLGQGWVEVDVADDGVGMTAAVQARIFEPFFTTKGSSGTGLGLPLVQRIVAQHQGSIEVRSTPGQGTNVRLLLPPAGSHTAPAAPAAASSHDHQPMRILAVDDQAQLAELIKLMLTPHGHDVALATSGEEALSRLAAEPFDVVISDIGMGDGINGWQLAEEVRARHPSVHVCLATGWGASIDPAEARKRGIAGVVAKPYRIADLLELVAACAARGS